jgi:LysR family transcriptional regulator, glycine cleavage system transcriptional activator
MRRMPPMGALEAFLVVANSRTLAAASTELSLSVSALSRRIQALEAYVGRPLFERLHHELRLTADGEWLLDQARPAFDALAQALGELSQSDAHSIALGVPPSFATAWLLPRFGGFRQAHPDITVSFDSSGEPFSKLGTSLDALIVFAEDVVDGFYARELRRQAAFAVCAPGYLEAGADIAAAISSRPLLVHKGLPKVLPLGIEAFGLKPSPSLQVQSYDNGPMLLAAAEAGLGIAITLGDSVRFYPGEGRLEQPFGEAVPTPYSYYFVCRQSALRGRALRRFHDWIIREAADDAVL